MKNNVGTVTVTVTAGSGVGARSQHQGPARESSRLSSKEKSLIPGPGASVRAWPAEPAVTGSFAPALLARFIPDPLTGLSTGRKSG